MFFFLPKSYINTVRGSWVEGVYWCGEILVNRETSCFIFMQKYFCFFLFFSVFRSVLLNGGTLFINCNIAPKASVLKQGLAFSNLTEDAPIPRSGL